MTAALMLTAPPHWLTAARIRAYSIMVVAIFGLGFLAWTALALSGKGIDPHGKPVGYDFITFWSAARLALEGRPEAAFDWQAIGAMQRVAVPALEDALFLWHYPPTFLLAVLPLGLLPYLAALAVFLAATAALWAGFVRALLADRRAWVVAAAAPAGLYNLLDGQNGFLTAGLAGLALLWLDRRPRLAGLLIGLLAIKPHLAVLFPLALAASGRWRAFAAAALAATVFGAVSAIAFGPATLAAFLHDLPTLRGIVDGGGLPWAVMPSPYVLVLSLAAPPAAAALVQGAAALTAALCVWRAWRGDGPFEAKAAVLLTGSLLVSPYLFAYDLTWAVAAIGFLARLGLREGFARREPEFLLAGWLVPVLAAPVYWLSGVQAGSLVLVMLLGVALHRTRRN